MTLPTNKDLRISLRSCRAQATEVTDVMMHLQHPDQRGSLMLFPGNLLGPRIRRTFWERNQAPFPPSRPRCNFVHPRQLSAFPERLKLHFSSDEILSGFEDIVSSGTDEFTAWVKTDPRDILVHPMVDVQEAVADFREASERTLGASSQTKRFSKHLSNRPLVQKRRGSRWALTRSCSSIWLTFKELQHIFAKHQKGNLLTSSQTVSTNILLPDHSCRRDTASSTGTQGPDAEKKMLSKSSCRQVARHYFARGVWVWRSWHSYWSVPSDPLRRLRDSLQQGHLQPQHRRQVHLLSWYQARLARSSNGRRTGTSHARLFFHVPHFVDHQSAARSPSQCCLCTSATSTPRREASPKSSSSPIVLSWLLNRLTLQVTSMVLRGDAATETTSVLSTKLLQTMHCRRYWAVHHCGDPGSIPNNRADVCGFLEPSGSDRYCKVRMRGAFSIPRKVLGLRPNDQSCHHETWLHLDFLDWRNTFSQRGAHDRRILLEERPAPLHQGAQKRRISDIMSDHSLSSWTREHSNALSLLCGTCTSSRSDLMTFCVLRQTCDRRRMFWLHPSSHTCASF